jgi:hypothetical protein
LVRIRICCGIIWIGTLKTFLSKSFKSFNKEIQGGCVSGSRERVVLNNGGEEADSAE